MKKLLLVTLISLISFTVLSQSCLPEGITFTSQAQIDSFQIVHPNCTEIEGDVIINGVDITNLNGLSVLNSIGGDFDIGPDGWVGTSLTNLSGLENLTSVGINLGIYYSHSLTSLTGLEGLTSVGGHLTIYNNAALTDITALEGLTSIGGGLGISENQSLSNLAGLDNITSIGLSVWLDENAALTSLSALESLTSIGGELGVLYNDNLISLTGLDNIDAGSISNLTIHHNTSLTQCEVLSICDYLASPSGTIEIHDNATGCNSQEEVEEACLSHCLPEGITFTTQAQIDSFQINYPNCTEIEGDVTVRGDDITNLNGFSVLNSFGRRLMIYDNKILSSIAGLENVSSIEGYVMISSNDALTSLTGLENITSLESSLTIGGYDDNGNPSLVNLTGLNSLISVGGYVEILGNNALLSLSGLGNLINIGIGGLRIEENFSLLSLSGLENITSVEGDLVISNNFVLNSLSELVNLSTIGGYIQIFNNDSLESLTGLDNIDANSIDWELMIYGNNSLSMCDVQSICDFLISPNGTILIENNAEGCNSQQEVEEACASSINEISALFGIYTRVKS